MWRKLRRILLTLLGVAGVLLSVYVYSYPPNQTSRWWCLVPLVAGMLFLLIAFFGRQKHVDEALAQAAESSVESLIDGL